MKGSAVFLISPPRLSARSGVLVLLLSRAKVLRLLPLQLLHTLLSRKPPLLPNSIYRRSPIVQPIQQPDVKPSQHLQRIWVGHLRLHTKAYLTTLGSSFP